MESFARAAPALVALIYLQRDGHIPGWEQKLSAGAAAQNLLLATHALGFVGNWLTGAPAFLPGISEALGVEGKAKLEELRSRRGSQRDGRPGRAGRDRGFRGPRPPVR